MTNPNTKDNPENPSLRSVADSCVSFLPFSPRKSMVGLPRVLFGNVVLLSFTHF